MLELVHSKPLYDWEGPLPIESNEAYHSRIELLSSTDIKHIGKSAAHYKAYVLDRVVRHESRALDFGDWAHKINIEQKHDDFVVIPSFKPITEKHILKSGPNKGQETDKVVRTVKDQVEEFEALHPNKTLLTTSEYDNLYFMHDVFLRNPHAQEITRDSLKEQGFAYWDEQHKRRCRFRADWINPTRGVITDYKTAIGASPYEFSKAMARYQYHISAAHYKLGAERIFARDFRFILIAQEKVKPFAIGIYEMRKSSMDRAIAQRSKFLMKINEYTQVSSWPDYSEHGVMKIEVPEYAYGEE